MAFYIWLTGEDENVVNKMDKTTQSGIKIFWADFRQSKMPVTLTRYPKGRWADKPNT